MRMLPVCLLTALAHVASAQGAGTIEGTVTDSVHARPLAGAEVRALRVAPAAETTYVATTDSRGKFRFDRIDAGRYAVSFVSGLLDSLEFGGRTPQVLVAAGETARIALAIPSGASLRAAACPGSSFPSRTGALLGFVENADTERALADAEVLVAWSALGVDSAKGTVVPDEYLARTRSDASGQYRLCGVPTGEWLVVQVQHEGRAGAVVRLSIRDAIGVHVRNLSFSAGGSIALASLARSDTALVPTLVGTASLAGTVRTETGAPVVGARVAVVSTETESRTNANGQYALATLPAGTQVVEVRQLGYRIERRAVELRAGRSTVEDIILGRAVMLDSIATIATRLRYPDFESHRKFAIRGTFIDPEAIDRRRQYSSYVSDMLREAPGTYTVVGQGTTAVVLHDRCPLLVVVDNDMTNRSVNDVAPSDVGAIAMYPDKASAPSRLHSFLDNRRYCGALLIWTRR